MGKRRPIAIEKRSYVVLKKLLKSWYINQNSHSLKKQPTKTRTIGQFNWLKWLLKSKLYWLAFVPAFSFPRIGFSIPKIQFTVPKIKFSVPNIKLSIPKVQSAATLPKPKPSVKKLDVSPTRTMSYPAYLGWSMGPLLNVLQFIKVPAFSITINLPRFSRKPSRATAKKPHLVFRTHRFKIGKLLKKLPKLPALPKLPIISFGWLSRTRVRLAIVLVLLIGLIGTGLTSYTFVFKDLPSPQQLSQRDQNVTTRIVDRNGNILYRVYEDENRTIVSLQDIPADLVHATIAIEDKDFYHHYGFSITGIVRAAIANTRGQTIQQGGSTITQQLVKQRLLTSERTIQRKLREFVLAIMAEFTYSKDQILEMYFNQVPYGGSTYGVEEAAQRYFSKSVKQLSLAESALLAGLPAAPSAYSPFGTDPASGQYAKDRQREVLNRMVADGYISQVQADEAFNQQLEFSQDSIDIKAPHFVMYVRQILADQYGEEAVNKGGLEVTTTLDLDLQNKAQNIVTTEVNKLARLRVSNGAALVTNPQTGEILAMIGSKDYFDFAHDGQVNVTTSERQPGSSIKPLTYALLMERGKTPNTILDDSPITYHIQGSPPYSPQNYDGKFHGKVTIREALGSSYNIPAVKALAEVGISNEIDGAEKMGIDTWHDRKRFGLSLTLGGGEVKMTDMAELYSTFANYGYTVDLNPILEVKNYKGEVLYRNTCVLDNKGCTKERNLNPLVAYQITDILKDNRARTPAFGPRSVLHIPNQEVAVKTGTTNSLRDNWAIGYTTDHLVAVWVGNNNNLPMSYIASGVTGASPIWNDIVRLTLDDENPHVFSTPEGMIKVSVCSTTGTLPCQGCPSVREELFVPGTEPTKQCSPSWFTKKPAENKDQPNRDQILNGATTIQ